MNPRILQSPTAHPLVDDELLRSLGLRMTRFDNYNIFYYYDMQNDVVYIIRVLYNKVDWQSLFKRWTVGVPVGETWGNSESVRKTLRKRRVFLMHGFLADQMANGKRTAEQGVFHIFFVFSS